MRSSPSLNPIQRLSSVGVFVVFSAAAAPPKSLIEQRYEQHRLTPSLLLTQELDTPAQVISSNLLRPWAGRESVSTHQRITALRLLENKAQAEQMEALWTVYLRSRFDALPEDPDVFERALDILLDLSASHKRQSDHFFQSQIGNVLLDCILENITLRWSDRYPNVEALIQHWRENHPEDVAKIASQLNKEASATWQKFDVDWLNSFQTEHGSTVVEVYRLGLRELMRSWETDPKLREVSKELGFAWGITLDSVISLEPPTIQPGDVQGFPTPRKPNLRVQQFESKWTMRSSLLFCWLLTLLVIPIRSRVRWLWHIATPIFLFGSVELMLSWFNTPLIEKKSFFQFNHWKIEPWADHQTYWQTEGSYVRAQLIPKQKSKPRVIILGASSAHGSNHLWEDTFGAQVSRTLDVDVVNLAVGGTTSNGILHMVPYTLEAQPDLIVIYYGHNEVAQFVQLALYDQQLANRLALKSVLWRSQIYTLLYEALFQEQIADPQFSAEELAPQQYDEMKQLAHWNFKQNMAVVLRHYEQQNVPVLLLSPPTNYPFALPWPQGETPQTIASAQSQIDNDPTLTTATSTIKEHIKGLAQQYGTGYLDVDELFHLHSPNGTSANGLFWDELHPSVLGHQWIAETITPWINCQITDEAEGCSPMLESNR